MEGRNLEGDLTMITSLEITEFMSLSHGCSLRSAACADLAPFSTFTALHVPRFPLHG
jgi:hypothetical protein